MEEKIDRILQWLLDMRIHPVLLMYAIYWCIFVAIVSIFTAWGN